MTLRLLKKLRTTRSNTRLTSRVDLGRPFRWALCGLLMAAMMMTAAAEGGAAKRRRHTSLDRLKRRSATARWDELRQLWRPTAEGEQLPSEAVPLESAEENSDAQPTTVIDTEESTPVLFFPPATNGFQQDFVDPVGAGQPFGIGQLETVPATNGVPGLPPLPPPSATVRMTDPRHQQPVWHLAQDPNGESRAAGGGVKQAAANVLPKPITAILPYYDYSPDGGDPCEFLCPRPEGCPEGEDSKPCPELVELPDISLAGRHFVDTHVLWEPSNLFHNPLYFEDHALERYGHTHNPVLQPLVSIGKFGVQLIGLPYQMALHPVHEHQYTLGWHRPGECVPYRYHLPPWNTKAAITAGAAYTGLIYLFP